MVAQASTVSDTAQTPLGYRSYQYDTFSRMTGYTNYVWDPDDPETVFDFSVALVYDDINRVSQTRYSFLDRTLTYVPTYGTSDRLEKFALSSVWSQTYAYDDLQRLDSKILKNASEAQIAETSYTYAPGWSSYANATTTLVASEENSAANETWSYSYDNKGRITQISLNNTIKAKYHYDSVTGFLVREDNADLGETFVYSYDNAGNMVRKEYYSFTTGTLGSCEWEEELYFSDSDLGKQYDGACGIMYDSLGNISYSNDTYLQYYWDGSLLTWIEADGGLPDYSFEYNADGIRTKKGYSQYDEDWVYHDYTLDGSTILRETITEVYWGEINAATTLYYYYDASGLPIGLNWNGADYYYYKNILGDVLGIMNSSGTMVVRYSYDAWGNPISTTGSMANTLGQLNPFRYRSYYYDTETGYYYLQARYYDPTIGRFISPDPVLDTTSAIGCNPYAYCGNDPVNRVDPTGHFWDIVWDVVSIAWGIADVIMNYDDIWAWVGLCFDLIDLIPFVTCVGDAIRGVRIADKAIDAVDTAVDVTDTVTDIADAAGDTVSVAKKATKAAPTPYEIGRQGEIAAGVDFTKPKQHISINGRTRIPDILTDDTLTEVKNVKYISNTRQLRDFADFAKQTNRRLVLKVNRNTVVASTVVAAGWEIVRFN